MNRIRLEKANSGFSPGIAALRMARPRIVILRQ
jgi:hypothetical protein